MTQRVWENLCRNSSSRLTAVRDGKDDNMGHSNILYRCSDENWWNCSNDFSPQIPRMDPLEGSMVEGGTRTSNWNPSDFDKHSRRRDKETQPDNVWDWFFGVYYTQFHEHHCMFIARDIGFVSLLIICADLFRRVCLISSAAKMPPLLRWECFSLYIKVMLNRVVPFPHYYIMSNGAPCHQGVPSRIKLDFRRPS